MMPRNPNQPKRAPRLKSSNPRPKLPEKDVRETIDFSPKTYEELKNLAGNGSVADALRDSIAISKWFNDTIKSGAKILVFRDGKYHEVIKIQ